MDKAMPRVLNRHWYHDKPMPEGAVDIGRPSKWGNPFKEGTLEMYREWIVQQPHLMAALPELKGKDLARVLGAWRRGQLRHARVCCGDPREGAVDRAWSEYRHLTSLCSWFRQEIILAAPC